MFKEFIEDLKTAFWLARHGCDLSEINFWRIELYGEIHIEFLPFKFNFLPKDFYLLRLWIPDTLRRAYYSKDWKSAKSYLASNDLELDEIPF